MKYRKKPVVIEAFRYTEDKPPDWFVAKVQSGEIMPQRTCCDMQTLEGVMRGWAGDWIIQGVKGEIYPCKPDIFEATYDPVDEQNETQASQDQEATVPQTGQTSSSHTA